MKGVIFDLDGVLVETKKIHFDALNKAIEKYDKNYIIKYSDHLTRFDGLSTKRKLELLNNDGLSKSLIEKINNEKKNITEKMLSQKLNFNSDIFDLFKYFRAPDLDFPLVSYTFASLGFAETLFFLGSPGPPPLGFPKTLFLYLI